MLDGVVCIGYPLHPNGKPQVVRDEILSLVRRYTRERHGPRPFAAGKDRAVRLRHLQAHCTVLAISVFWISRAPPKIVLARLLK